MSSFKLEFLIFCGPSGAGKSTIIKHLLSIYPRFRMVKSFTTRKIRPNEIDGRDYYFIKTTDFEKMISDGDFINHFQVENGDYYGITKEEIKNLYKEDNIGVLDLDLKGVQRFKKMFEGHKIVSVLVTTHNLEILKKRMISRAIDTDCKEFLKDLEIRLKKAQEVFFDMRIQDFLKLFNFLVDNDFQFKDEFEFKKMLDSTTRLLNKMF